MSKNTSQSTVDKYKELLEMINSFLGEARRAQDTSFNYSQDEIEEVYKNIIKNSFMNKDIFIKILNLIGNGKIKCVNMHSENLPEEILKFHKHSIIENICISTAKQLKTGKQHKRYYLDNFIAYYIILDRYLKHSIKNRPRGFCSFMESMYFGFCDLLYKYIVFYGNINSDDMEYLPRVGVSPVRHDLNILMGIKSLLYTGYTSDDSVNIAVFALRGYIESWIRAGFNLFLSRNGRYIQISVIFDALRKVTESEPFDEELKKYINSLSLINDWSNFYIHWKPKAIFWIPHFIELYLLLLSEELKEKLIKDTGTWHVTPPLTQKDSEFYNKVREELTEYL